MRSHAIHGQAWFHFFILKYKSSYLYWVFFQFFCLTIFLAVSPQDIWKTLSQVCTSSEEKASFIVVKSVIFFILQNEINFVIYSLFHGCKFGGNLVLLGSRVFQTWNIRCSKCRWYIPEMQNTVLASESKCPAVAWFKLFTNLNARIYFFSFFFRVQRILNPSIKLFF